MLDILTKDIINELIELLVCDVSFALFIRSFENKK